MPYRPSRQDTAPIEGRSPFAIIASGIWVVIKAVKSGCGKDPNFQDRVLAKGYHGLSCRHRFNPKQFPQ
jgi:hypothetical protein